MGSLSVLLAEERSNISQSSRMMRLTMLVMLVGAASAFWINQEESGRSLTEVVDGLNQKSGEIKEVVGQKVRTIGEWFNNVFGFVKDKANFIVTTVIDGTEYVLGVVGGAVDKVTSGIQDKVDTITDAEVDTEVEEEEMMVTRNL